MESGGLNAFFVGDLARWYQHRRASAAEGEEIHSALFSAGAQIGVFEIQWGDFTNDELVNLKTAVNAKAPRGKGARDREIAMEKPVGMARPAGAGAQQPKSLRLCTFAPLRSLNCSF